MMIYINSSDHHGYFLMFYSTLIINFYLFNFKIFEHMEKYRGLKLIKINKYNMPI